jgi:hypothetical protein
VSLALVADIFDGQGDTTLFLVRNRIIIKLGQKSPPPVKEAKMNDQVILSQARIRLAELVEGVDPAIPDVLDISPWVAMSLMQKAIRRGEHSLAQHAAATLLRLAPEKLWRRLGVVAFEDVGVASFDALFSATGVLGGKRLRSKWGGEWRTASTLVQLLSEATKCRAADDLLIAAERHPNYRRARNELSEKSVGELIRIAMSRADWPVRAIAAWYAIGTDRRPSPFLEKRVGNPAFLFDALREWGYPHTVVAISWEGFRKVGEVLCPFTAMLAREACKAPKQLRSDQRPPEIIIRGVPGWAYDTYTREGRHALHCFLGTDAPAAKWVRQHVPRERRTSFLGDVVFRIEGGLVKNRLCWPTGTLLRKMVDEECYGPSAIFDLMRLDLPKLNEVRGHVC